MNPEAAADYNDERDFGRDTWRKIQTHIGAKADGIPGPKTARALADYQDSVGLVPDGKFGSKTIAHFQQIWHECRPLTLEAISALMQPTFRHETAGRMYSAHNRDGEFEGWFDRPGRPHRYSQNGPTPTHVGSSVSAPQFAVKAGSPGKMIYRARELAIEYGEMDALNDALDGHLNELVDVWNRPTKPLKVHPELSIGLRAPCVMPVAGHDTWKGPWIARLKRASKLKCWQVASDQIAYEEYFKPMLKEARKHGLMMAGDLAVLFDAAINHGGAGMRKRLNAAVEYAAKRNRSVTITDVINQFGPSKHGRRWNAFEGVRWWVRYGEVA